jgi:hypothetical protein
MIVFLLFHEGKAGKQNFTGYDNMTDHSRLTPLMATAAAI